MLDRSRGCRIASVTRRAIITGRVQGVFFRDGARRQALALGVSGWARNRSDDSVEVLAQGYTAAVEALLAWCEDGPPRANVETISIEEAPPIGLTTFEVR